MLSTFGTCVSAYKTGSLHHFITGVLAVGRMLRCWRSSWPVLRRSWFSAWQTRLQPSACCSFSLNPLWAAALSLFFLKERLRPVTAAALVMSLVSVGIVFIPPAVSAGTQADAGTQVQESTAVGDAYSLAAGVLFALYIILARQVGQRSQGRADIPVAAAIGGYIAMFFALGMSGATIAPPASVGFDTVRWPEWSFWLAVVVQGVGVGICLVCISLAPRLATGPEVGIVMLLQLLLSPLWVWLAFGEELPHWTIAGGLLLLFTLAAHELAMHRIQAAEALAAESRTAGNSTRRSGEGPNMTVCCRSERRGRVRDCVGLEIASRGGIHDPRTV